MKRILFLLPILLMAFISQAQTMSNLMSKYAEGCFALREAIDQKDFGKLLDAKIILSGLQLDQYHINDEFSPLDSLSQSVIGKPNIMFTPQFAADLAKNRTITLEEIEDAHIMRKGGAGNLSLWHASIAPHSSASFSSDGYDDCEMFLCSTTDAKMKLSINSESTGQIYGSPIKGASAWFVNWILPESGEQFIFTITNDGESQASFVIAIN